MLESGCILRTPLEEKNVYHDIAEKASTVAMKVYENRYPCFVRLGKFLMYLNFVSSADVDAPSEI